MITIAICELAPLSYFAIVWVDVNLRRVKKLELILESSENVSDMTTVRLI